MQDLPTTVEIIAAILVIISRFLAAAVSLAFWSISQWPTVRIWLSPRDEVQVITADPFAGAVIVNRGDHEVFVTNVFLYMTGRTSKWTAQQFPVGQTLLPEKFLRVPAPLKDNFGNGFFVCSIKDAKIWNDFVDQAFSDSQCFQILLFATDDPFLRAVIESAPTVNKIPASGFVEYRTITARTYTRTVVPTGIIRARSTPDCERKVTNAGGR